ncbi:potassium-transporting ATPase subunit KdpC [Terriglobus roseus]|uniref:Potassium-transporting ATPase KdpC subunit n=1 Tax=Terriglobus roseus TaxID=392734 RepID=A0A1H4JBA6_9BACT|nr:potassium-transporting ATPase subunit KdpC [Terriglobus roseus]SEB43590.1 K+-transporting ATPase ATPase C chain [Terriglobus roseus]
MKKHIITACLYTVITAVLLGIAYPLAITGLSHLLFRDKADGQLIQRNGEAIGSRLIGQPFTGARYFHSRPSAAGAGYDAANSGGSNLGPSNKSLIDRVGVSTRAESNGAPVPIDLVTASASGLDPDLSPAAALYQVPRVARERHLPEVEVTQIVRKSIIPRQFGLLGEPRVNVLQLNLALDQGR